MTTAELPKFQHLLPPHVGDLVSSGLSVETILLCGFYSGSKEEIAEILGYGGAGSGLVIPYHANGSEAGFKRVKLDSAGSDGKAYRSPKGAGNHLYVPKNFPGGAGHLADISTAFVTEGEKKSAKACQEGLHCIGLAGVWSFMAKQNRISLPINDLDRIPWDGRNVVVVFDSDIVTNPKIERAEAELGQELTRRGAKVTAIRLPPGPNGRKVGLDDYLMAHSVTELLALPRLPLGLPSIDAADGVAWSSFGYQGVPGHSAGGVSLAAMKCGVGGEGSVVPNEMVVPPGPEGGFAYGPRNVDCAEGGRSFLLASAIDEPPRQRMTKLKKTAVRRVIADLLSRVRQRRWERGDGRRQKTIRQRQTLGAME